MTWDRSLHSSSPVRKTYCWHLTSDMHSRMMVFYACLIRGMTSFEMWAFHRLWVQRIISLFICLEPFVDYGTRWLCVVEIVCFSGSLKKVSELVPVLFEPRISWSENENVSVDQKTKPSLILINWDTIVTSLSISYLQQSF